MKIIGRILILCLLALGCLGDVFGGSSGVIDNPYYSSAYWKIWMDDPSPVLNGSAQVVPPPISRRLFPVDLTPAEAGDGLLTKFSSSDFPGRRYAGIHETLFLSEDNFHTSVLPEMMGTSGNYMRLRAGAQATTYSLMHETPGGGLGANPRFKLGSLFTNQSTTLMGHNVTNNFFNAQATERNYYFGNVVRAGPADGSFGTSSIGQANDYYHLLLPSHLNTVGRSGSPMPLVTRLVAASAYLPIETKKLLLRHGAHANAMHYGLKAALPYQVGYGHAIRHRVAYNGGGIVGNSHLAIPPEHAADHYIDVTTNYDPFMHFDRMVEIFRGMTVAPPIAIFGEVEVLSGTPGFQANQNLKTAYLVHQAEGETVQVRVSTAACYDLQGLPLDVRLEVVTGNRRTTIEDEGSGSFLITVPADDTLPYHRTTILMIANNGVYDSNPAALSIRRSRLNWISTPPLAYPRGLEDRKVLAGTSETLDLFSAPAAASPVTMGYFLWDGTNARLDGSQLVLAPESSAEPSQETVVAVADDTITGHGMAGAKMRYEVVRIRADVEVDFSSGFAPLSVEFDGSNSADADGGSVELLWDFGDGTSSTLAAPQKIFAEPGLYHVTLTATGSSGTDTTTRTIHVYPTPAGAGGWPLRISNGWDDTNIDPAVWSGSGAQVINGNFVLNNSGNPSSVASTEDLTLPCYFEMDFIHGATNVGIWLFGQRFGRTTLSVPDRLTQQAYPFSFHRQPAQSSHPPVFLAGYPEQPGTRTQGLRVFAEEDPNHPGKMRLSGRIITAHGERAFQFDDLDILDHKIRLDRPTNNGTALTVHRLQVWAPAGATPVSEASLALFDSDGELISDSRGTAITEPIGDGRFFGVTQSPGEQLSRTFRVVNRGNEPLSLTGDPVIGFESGVNFSLLAPPTESTLQPGESTEFTVRFSDNGGGYKSTWCQIPSSDPQQPDFRVPVSAFGYISPAIDLRGNGLTISPGRSQTHRADFTRFASTEVGTSREHTFILHNRGTGALTVGGASLSGDDAGQFSIVKQPRSSTGPLGSTAITVRYFPTEPGEHAATITIANSDEELSFPIVGTSILPVPRDLQVSFDGVSIQPGDDVPTAEKGTDFGICSVGGVVARIFEVSALAGNVRVYEVAITGPGAANFIIQRDPPGIVTPAVPASMRVLYQPSAVQEDVATLTLLTDDTETPEIAFALRGQGVAGGALEVRLDEQLIFAGGTTFLAGPQVDFGLIEEDASESRTFVVRNASPDTSLEITGLSFSGSHGEDLQVLTELPLTLAPGASGELIVQWSPQAGGPQKASITVHTNAPGNSDFSFQVSASSPRFEFESLNLPHFPAGVIFAHASLADMTGDGEMELALMGYPMIAAEPYFNGSATDPGVANPSGVFRRTVDGWDRVPGYPLLNLAQGQSAWVDLDGDGVLELFAAGQTFDANPDLYNAENGNAEIRFGFYTDVQSFDGNAFTRTPLDVARGGNAVLAVGDLNNDGFDDLLSLTREQTLERGPASVYVNGAGIDLSELTEGLPWADFPYDDATLSVTRVEVFDMNQDGKLDLVTTSKTEIAGQPTQSQVVVWLNGGNMQFDPQTVIELPVGNLYSVVGDFNSDGRFDVLAIEFRSNLDAPMHLVVNDGNGNFTKAYERPSGLMTHPIAVDMNHNGHLDLLAVHTSPATGVPAGVLLINDGSGNFTPDVTTTFAGHNLGMAMAVAGHGENGLPAIFTSGLAPAFTPTPEALPALFNNRSGGQNLPPGAPVDLAAVVVGGRLELAWSPASDDATPSAALTYNLRVGTVSGGQNVVPAYADLVTGQRRISAPGQFSQTEWEYALPPGEYYVAVQAIDSSFVGGAWSEEIVVTIPEPDDSAYESWRTQIAWNGANSSRLGDASGDGVSNFEKFAFGEPPLESAPSPVRYAFSGPEGGSIIEVQYPRARAELVYTVEMSESLLPDSWTTDGIVQDATTPVGETATVTIPYNPAEFERVFFRLRIEEP